MNVKKMRARSTLIALRRVPPPRKQIAESMPIMRLSVPWHAKVGAIRRASITTPGFGTQSPLRGVDWVSHRKMLRARTRAKLLSKLRIPRHAPFTRSHCIARQHANLVAMMSLCAKTMMPGWSRKRRERTLLILRLARKQLLLAERMSNLHGCAR